MIISKRFLYKKDCSTFMIKKLLLGMLLMLTFCLSVNGALSDDLLYYYKFDNSPEDATGNYGNATFYGNSNYVSGKLNNALNLDGTGDYVQPASLTGTIDYSEETLNFWFNANTAEINWETVVGIASFDTNIRINDGNKIDVKVFGSASVQSSSNLRDNNWHMITVLFKTTSFEVFIDGSSIGSQNKGQLLRQTANSLLVVGQMNNFGD